MRNQRAPLLLNGEFVFCLRREYQNEEFSKGHN